MPVKRGGGLSGNVAEDRRESLALEWLEHEAASVAVQAEHLLAIQVAEEAYLQDADDAGAESHRRLAVHKKRRDQFQLTVELNEETSALELGDTISLNYNRFGLTPIEGDDEDAGHPFVIIGIEPDAARNELQLTVWGTAALVRNIVDGAGDYLIDHNGNYLISGEGYRALFGAAGAMALSPVMAGTGTVS